MQADNGVYTPSPKTVEVVLYRDWRGDEKCQAQLHQDHLIRMDGGEIIARQVAKVVSRGNLAGDDARWHQIELADGSRHMVLIEGS